MSLSAVHWHEGMFLRPHHFLASSRHWHEQGHRGEKWDHHHDWGLRSIKLSLDALGNFRLAVGSLEARLRDGTLVSVPEDGVLAEADLKPAFERSNAVTAYLGVPMLSMGRANVAAEGATEGVRYRLATQVLQDENTGVNPQPIQVRMLNVRLLLSGQDHAGYEVLPIARVVKSPRAEATPQLDETYFPPMLACDAWGPLRAGILEALYDRVGKKIDALAAQVLRAGSPSIATPREIPASWSSSAS